MVGEGNLFYAYILKSVINSQGEFFGEGGRLFEKRSVSQRETRGLLKKTKQDIEDIFSTMAWYTFAED